MFWFDLLYVCSWGEGGLEGGGRGAVFLAAGFEGGGSPGLLGVSSSNLGTFGDLGGVFWTSGLFFLQIFQVSSAVTSFFGGGFLILLP